MALTGSGEISIAGSTSGRSIALEFGRGATATLSLSELYRGGGIVPNATANNNIPTSGAISLSNFYNAVNRITGYNNLATNLTNYNVSSSSFMNYVAGVMDITIYIPTSSTISSTGGSAALTIGALSPGDKVFIDNRGTIQGHGGKGGGEYGAPGNYFYKSDGAAGGNAIDISGTNATVTISNSGIIAGGGGGGGNGQAWNVTYPTGYTTGIHYFRAGGGGGGQGNYGGGAGNYVGPGNVYPTNYYAGAASGSAGTSSAAGAGGTGDYGHWWAVSPNYYGRGGSGGSGGARGASGATGSRGTYSGQDLGGPYNVPDPSGNIPYGGAVVVYTGYSTFSAGGAAGNAIKGTAKLSAPVTNTGTILGPQVA
ncbi:MAG: hypothetical protein RLY61_903 [Candidatus Parcubacteria bacterium]|jgi:hypothetical protein